MNRLNNLTKFRVKQARRRLFYEIKANGINIQWRQPIFKDDGMNGKIKVNELEQTIRGILINSSSGYGNMNMTESGRKEEGTHTLLILYDKCIKPEYLTEFYTDDNQQYRVVNVYDINNLHIAYSISLIHTPRKMGGYNGS